MSAQEMAAAGTDLPGVSPARCASRAQGDAQQRPRSDHRQPQSHLVYLCSFSLRMCLSPCLHVHASPAKTVRAAWEAPQLSQNPRCRGS